MSDTTKQTVNVISIPEDAVVTFKIGGTFYQRLNKLIIDFGDSVDQKILIQTMAKIQRGRTHNDDYAFNMETLIILMRDLEKAFQDSGQAVNNNIEVDVPEGFEEIKVELDKDDNSKKTSH